MQAGELMITTKGCFGGGNGERGFVNYFDAVLQGVDRIYVLKGGCGCGKSTFMRGIAAEAERRGEAAELIYCASDPDSLDGVVLRERGVGIVDGTAPHERVPRCVGAVDCLVDLGEYLNSKELRKHADEIKALTLQKSACYKRAYGLLAAAGGLREEIARLNADAILWGKLEAAAARIAAKHAQKENAPHMHLRGRSAFCGKGIVTAEDYGFNELYAVNDVNDTAYLFYRALFSACLKQDCSITVSPDALTPNRISALRLDGKGVLFCTDGKEETSGTVNMERFVNRQALCKTRQKRRFLEKARKGLTEAAREALAEARAVHARLEDIYVPAASFSRVDKRRALVTKEIFA